MGPPFVALLLVLYLLSGLKSYVFTWRYSAPATPIRLIANIGNIKIVRIFITNS